MLTTFGETMLRLSPPPGERVETADELEVYVGGAESNVAVAASRLGVEATWLSKVVDAPPGRRVVNALREQGVDPAVVWSDDGRQGTYYVEPGGDPRGTDVVYDRADAAVTTATAAELPLDRVRGADVFHTSGITPALSETLASTTADLLAAAQDAGTHTVFDLNYRSKLWSPAEARETVRELLGLVDTLIVAKRDAARVLERDGDPVVVANGLAADHDHDTVVVTRGDEGALALHDGTVHEQDVYAAETLDPIGSGDAFVGGFLARRLRGGDVGDALAWGAATAALKRTFAGDVALVTPAEVEAVVGESGGGISR